MGALLQYLTDSAQRSRAQDYAAQQYGADSSQAAYANAFPEQFAQLEAQKYQKQAEGQAIQQFYGGGAQQGGAQAPQGQTQQQADQQAQNAGITWDDPGFADMGGGSALAALAQQQQQPAQPQGPSPSSLARYGAIANLPGPLQSIAAQQMMFEGNSGGGVSNITSLDQLPAAMAPTIKSMLAGKADPSLMRRNPATPLLLQIANQIDPNFDQTTWQQRSKTAKDFTPGGKVGGQLTQAQTAINHLSSMVEASDKLGGASAGIASPLLNSVYNATQSQNPALIDYNRYAGLGGDDIANFIGGGKSTIEAREKQANQLSINNSPDARKEAAKVGVQAMFAKLEPTVDEYNRNFGTNKSVTDFLSPETKNSLAKLDLLPGADASTSASPPSALGRLTAPAAPDAGLAAELKRRGLLH